MKKRCGNRRGFTLVEVLCAFLMLSLSATLLLTGIGVAGSINQQARVSQQSFYEELSLAERQPAPTPGPAPDPTEAPGPTEGIAANFYAVDANGGVAQNEYGSRTVEIYSKGPGALSSYRLKETT